MNAIALQRTVSDMIAEFEAKSASLDGEILAFGAAVDRMRDASGIGGVFGENIWWRGAPAVDERAARKSLLLSGWKAIYSRLNIERIASATDKRRWEMALADPPPLTMDNVVATFGDYLLRTRFHLLRGLAETFVDLDPAYKSHSKVKIGVAGLPKRVILRSVGGYGTYGRDRLLDLMNALAAYQGKPLLEHREFAELDALSRLMEHKAGEVRIRDLVVRKFQNGNAHVIFDKPLLLDINRALAEFYGDVLPDAEDDDAEPKASTAVAKDLQYYPTPQAVIGRMLDEIGLSERSSWHGPSNHVFRVLEPSCGDGRIMREILARGHDVIGVEVHSGRAAEARKKGLSVTTANFLEMPASTTFDRVVMNPPFFGRHYLKHVRHALEFLRPGGLLISVLPATAWYDHGEMQGRWVDLPVASFAESGTNIPTGLLIVRKEAAE